MRDYQRRYNLTFEEKLEKLKDIVEKLETPDTLELDTSLELFEEGVGLVRSCRELLEKAELRIQKVSDVENDNDEMETASKDE
ncbi:exodeoxyribonuclease VII small subunit [Candidatus Poribacteria bacterium]|nr:exodeoxyribonuclease VII small subunit [Candidatus Poribacteria bacterium]MYB66735.1 exodeoxyribonuclease VII small subunit [Candidatus Poribacteria bacterium]MYF54584.1 exodeoxyribonuclease VII small subunit [Candidatus Poribacteria bacterium]